MKVGYFLWVLTPYSVITSRYHCENPLFLVHKLYSSGWMDKENSGHFTMSRHLLNKLSAEGGGSRPAYPSMSRWPQFGQKDKNSRMECFNQDLWCLLCSILFLAQGPNFFSPDKKLIYPPKGMLAVPSWCSHLYKLERRAMGQVPGCADN